MPSWHLSWHFPPPPPPLPHHHHPLSLLDESSIPVCEALEDPAFAWIDVSRDMPYSADMLLENVLDSSHVPFTHHKTISKRENAVPLPLALTSKIAPQVRTMDRYQW